MRERFPTNISSFPRKESMSFIMLLPDLPGCSVEQVSVTEETIVITAYATTLSVCCPNCHQASSRVHSIYTRSPRVLPSSGQPVRLLLQVRRFHCSNPTCRRKTFAESFPLLVAPRVQLTSSVRELLRVIGEAMGGEAGARLSQRLAMKCMSLARKMTENRTFGSYTKLVIKAHQQTSLKTFIRSDSHFWKSIYSTATVASPNLSKNAL